MVFIIKSNNGQRTARILENGTKKTDNLNDILEALKGMTFKLEIKIADIIVNDDEQSQDDKASGSVKLNQQEKSREDAREKERIEKMELEKNKQMELERQKELDKKRIREQEIDEQRMKERLRLLQDDALIAERKSKLAEEEREKLRIIEQEREKERQREKEKAKELELEKERLKLAREEKELLAESNLKKIGSDGSGESQKYQQVPSAASSRLYESPLSPIRKKLGRPKLIKGNLKIGAEIQAYCIAVSDENVPYISYDIGKLQKIVDTIGEMAESIEKQSKMSQIGVGDIVFGKSNDDNQWYRAIVEEVNGKEVKVFYFDWGIHEALPTDKLRHLLCPDLGLSNQPACAVKIEVSPKSLQSKEEFSKMLDTFNMRVDSYNDYSDTYTVTVLGKVG